jgi:hypothetical protein
MTMSDTIITGAVGIIILSIALSSWLRLYHYCYPSHSTEAKTVVNRERERGPNLPKREEPYDPVELELIRADIAFLKEQEEANGDAGKWRAAQEEADRTIFSRNHRFIV